MNNDPFLDTYRAVLSLTSATVTDDPEQTLNTVTDGLLDQLRAAEPAHVIAAYTSVINTFVDMLAAATDTSPEEAWRTYTSAANTALAEEEQ